MIDGNNKRHDAKHQGFIKAMSWVASDGDSSMAFASFTKTQVLQGVAGHQRPEPKQLAPCISGSMQDPIQKNPLSHSALTVSSKKCPRWKGKGKGLQGRGGSWCPAIDLVQLVTAGTAHFCQWV